MTELIKKIGILIIFFTLSVLLGWVLHSCYGKPKIKIVKETETKTEYIRVPTTPQESLDCAMSPIIIDGSISNNIMSIVAQDKCKKAKKDFTLAASNTYRKNILQPIVMYNVPSKLFMYGGLYQRSFGLFSFGGGGYYGDENNYGIIFTGSILF